MLNICKRIGVAIPEILLPAEGVDLTKWAVIACDQYTSQPEYWNMVEKFAQDSPSTLHLIFPEIYLEKGNREERINKINRTMSEYLEKNILIPQRPGFIYVERQICGKRTRKGMILAVDLDRYDYGSDSRALIRATEGTIIERLPPRVRIRENAAIELPHIMLLIDDPQKTVMEPVFHEKKTLDTVYDFDLMNGQHITGYRTCDSEITLKVLKALDSLSEPASYCSRYGNAPDRGVMLFAVGDGNHSLASAKACWENKKKSLEGDGIEKHPAKFALVEVVNLHDEGLVFEPIHRVVFNAGPDNMIDAMAAFFGIGKSDCVFFESEGEMTQNLEILRKFENCHLLPFVTRQRCGIIPVRNPGHGLETGTLQSFLDEYVKTGRNIRIDYIHGTDVVKRLASAEGNIGFILPHMDKKDLFKTVLLNGALPRKTFSMGEADEKRFYLECRKISCD